MPKWSGTAPTSTASPTRPSTIGVLAEASARFACVSFVRAPVAAEASSISRRSPMARTGPRVIMHIALGCKTVAHFPLAPSSRPTFLLANRCVSALSISNRMLLLPHACSAGVVHLSRAVGQGLIPRRLLTPSRASTIPLLAAVLALIGWSHSILVHKASLGVSSAGSATLISRSNRLSLFAISFVSMRSCVSAASASPRATHDLTFNTSVILDTITLGVLVALVQRVQLELLRARGALWLLLNMLYVCTTPLLVAPKVNLHVISRIGQLDADLRRPWRRL